MMKPVGRMRLRRASAAILLMLPLLLTSAPPSWAASDEELLRRGVSRVAPEELGVTLPEAGTRDALRLAQWRVEETSDGTRRLIFGEGIENVPLLENTVRMAEGAGADEATATSASSQKCLDEPLW